jgi:uncharacterized protein involved in exopolysaccharide biosynthesis
MTFRDIWSFLFKWKRLLLGLTALVFATVALLVYSLDQSYVAESKVLIESNRSPTKNVEFAPSGGLLVELLTTESEIVQSRAVMVKVVDELRPQDRPRKQPNLLSEAVRQAELRLGDWGLISVTDPREAWILRLQKRVKAKPIVNSGVFRIVYEDADPAWAARIVNAATRHFIELRLAVYSPRGSSAIIKGQIDDAEQQLESARRDLREQKQQRAVPALLENRGELVRSSSNFNDELVKLRGELAELRLRYAPTHEKVLLAEQQARELTANMTAQRREIERLEREEGTVKMYADAVEVAERNVRSLRTRFDEARALEAATIDMLNVRVIEFSDVPRKPTNPRILVMVLSLPVGFALALALALLFEYFDRRLHDPRAAQSVLNLPSLGSVPRLPPGRLAALIAPRQS